MMADYVPGNAGTVKRNPNYYGTNPIGPGKGDQLPYLDKIKYIIMTDLSTRLAAFRTGKLDQLSPFTIEDRAQMIKSNPELKEAAGGVLAVNLLFMRTDRVGTPCRFALSWLTDRAIDNIVDDSMGVLRAIWIAIVRNSCPVVRA